MNPFEFSMYALAERLHLSLGQVSAMPWEEFTGWCKYLEQREKQENPNMLDSPEAMLGGFGL